MDIEQLLKEKIIPANILGTHTHMKGEWMVGYQYMNMPMKHLRGGDVNGEITPTAMNMNMHMLEVMHAPSDDVTLMAMLSYHESTMDHITLDGRTFSTRSEGFGDLMLGGRAHVYRYKFDQHRILLELRASLPTGSVDARDFHAHPAAGKKLLPYHMQPGSGTVDLMPGIKYIGKGVAGAYGLDLEFTVRLGRNKHDYALGHEIAVAAWYSHQITDWLAPFIQFDAIRTGKFKGRDPVTSAEMAAVAPNTRSGDVVYIHTGVNIYFQGETFEGQRLALDYMRPIHHDTHLHPGWRLHLGWQWVF